MKVDNITFKCHFVRRVRSPQTHEDVMPDGTTALFYWPNTVVDADALRAVAREEVRNNQLIRAAAEGNLDAARVLHIGFWPFVVAFEGIIDTRPIQRQPLQKRFGDEVTMAILRFARKEVEVMKEEEGSHAIAWRGDSFRLGITQAELDKAPYVPEVVRLIEMPQERNLDWFFCVLAGTEFIAEELSRYLVDSLPFTQLIRGGHWRWGEIHLADHHEGPSHLELDLDLARAYTVEEEDKAAAQQLSDYTLQTIKQFGRAADDVHQHFFGKAQHLTLAAG